MPNPKPDTNPITWSRSARRFFQKGRSGAVPVLEAMEHLKLSRVGRGLGFRDEAGQAVPSLDKIIPKSFKTQSFFAARELSLTNKNTYTSKAPKDSYYTVLATWVDDTGKLRVTIRNFKGGRAIDQELESRKIVADIKSHLEKEGKNIPSTPEVEKWIRSRLHYVAR